MKKIKPLETTDPDEGDGVDEKSKTDEGMGNKEDEDREKTEKISSDEEAIEIIGR